MNLNLAGGMSLIEVLIAAVVVGLALVPIMTLTQSEHRKASFNEFHLLSHYRAKRILALLSSRSFIDIKSNLPMQGNGMFELEIPLPPIGEELKSMAQRDQSLAYLKQLEEKMSNLVERAEWKLLEPGLAKITVSVKWKLPQDGKKRNHREIKLSQLLARRNSSLLHRNLLSEK